LSAGQKTPLTWSLPALIDKQIRAYIGQLGSSLPGHVVSVSGSIVTVNFDVTPNVTLPQVSMPLASSEYVRLPIQAGDLGVCMPINAYIGATSGLGTASQTSLAQANLSNLVWVPIGSKGWTLPPGADANTLAMYGLSSLLLLDSFAGHCSVKLTSSAITLTFGANTVVLNASSIALANGSSSVTVTPAGVAIAGVLTINGMPYLAHTHSGVETGIDPSGPVVP
jgi:hypothetical protein